MGEQKYWPTVGVRFAAGDYVMTDHSPAIVEQDSDEHGLTAWVQSRARVDLREGTDATFPVTIDRAMTRRMYDHERDAWLAGEPWPSI